MQHARSAAGVWLRAGLAGLVLLIAADAAAQSGSTRALLRKIELLESKITDLERQVYRGEAPAARQRSATGSGGGSPVERAAQAELRVVALEPQLRAMTGRLEESEHRIRQLETRHERLVGAMDGRLKELERRLAAGAGAGLPPAVAQAGTVTTAQDGSVIVSSAGTQPLAPAAPAAGQTVASAQSNAVALPEGTPRQQYRYAQGLMRKSQFEAAEAAFQAFMATHPEHELTPLANYWLGDTLYRRKAYQDAAQVYFDGYQRFPNSAKANDTLLKLGHSLVRLGQVEEACGIYAELLSRLNKSERRLRPRTVREMLDHKCS